MEISIDGNKINVACGENTESSSKQWKFDVYQEGGSTRRKRVIVEQAGTGEPVDPERSTTFILSETVVGSDVPQHDFVIKKQGLELCRLNTGTTSSTVNEIGSSHIFLETTNYEEVVFSSCSIVIDGVTLTSFTGTELGLSVLNTVSFTADSDTQQIEINISGVKHITKKSVTIPVVFELNDNANYFTFNNGSLSMFVLNGHQCNSLSNAFHSATTVGDEVVSHYISGETTFTNVGLSETLSAFCFSIQINPSQALTGSGVESMHGEFGFSTTFDIYQDAANAYRYVFSKDYGDHQGGDFTQQVEYEPEDIDKAIKVVDIINIHIEEMVVLNKNNQMVPGVYTATTDQYGVTSWVFASEYDTNTTSTLVSGILRYKGDTASLLNLPFKETDKVSIEEYIETGYQHMDANNP